MQSAKNIFSYRQYWAKRFGTAPYLPMSRDEMDELGWDSCDVILVTGDAYVDHPSFGMAVIGRVLESQGFRVGIISQPDWNSKEDFLKLGKPNLFFGVTAGNMDSMVNRYTSDRRIRSNDAYTANGEGGKRPDRSTIIYTQRCREAYKGVPVIIGGIEASLRRIAHFDYWSEKVRRSILFDSKADLLVYGNAERQIIEIAHRLAANEPVSNLTDIRGTAFIVDRSYLPEGWAEMDAHEIDVSDQPTPTENPYAMSPPCDNAATPAKSESGAKVIKLHRRPKLDRSRTVVRLPDFETVKRDKDLYAHASRILHLETNPGNARALRQHHGNKDIWLNPPPIPLTTQEMDAIYDLPFKRIAHPHYHQANIPAYETIRFSVAIMRGCFGGCTFCSITEHEGRIIQSRSEDSIIREIEVMRDSVPGFTGVVSDLGGPTANMYRLACKSEKIESACRRLSCVYPGICENLNTDHTPLVKLYQRARALPGIKKILIASGLRYDLAVKSPEYVKELATHHVGGYLKIAPEHTEEAALSKMMKPGIGTYYRFKEMFDKYSKAAGKEQYLIPYFIAAHPGTSTEDMLNLALWLKQNGYRADQVQAFLPSPMALATAMWYSERNPLKKVKRDGEKVFIPRGLKIRRLHKAFLRYHDANNWPLLREALKQMGRSDLIGNGKKHLVPSWQPSGTGEQKEGKRSPRRKGGQFATQHNHGTPQSRKAQKSGSRRATNKASNGRKRTKK